jgi:hypothetical protein
VPGYSDRLPVPAAHGLRIFRIAGVFRQAALCFGITPVREKSRGFLRLRWLDVSIEFELRFATV